MSFPPNHPLQRELDCSVLELPDEETLSAEGELVCNREYVDGRDLGTWEIWLEEYEKEQRLLAQAKSQGGDFLEALDRLENKIFRTGQGTWFELGVSSMIIALYAAGAYPITSSRGSEREAPHVALFASLPCAQEIYRVLPTNLGIVNVTMEFMNGLAIYAHSPVHLITGSKNLYQHRVPFQRI